MTGKEVYRNNRERVFEIYGIDPKDKRYNCHHIIFKEDFEHNHNLDKRHLNDKSNLCPLLIEEHERLHKIVEEMEGHILYQAHRRRKRRRKRK